MVGFVKKTSKKLKQYLAGKDDPKNKKHKPVKDSGADKDTDSDGEDAEDAEKKKKYQRRTSFLSFSCRIVFDDCNGRV